MKNLSGFVDKPKKRKSVAPGGKLCFYVFMRTTVDLPDSLYRQAKAAAGQRGIKLRELFGEALEQFLSRGKDFPRPDFRRPREAPPKVTASELATYPDARTLRRAFPNGYRIVGPLIPSDEPAPVIRAARVAEEAARMDQQELEDHGRAR